MDFVCNFVRINRVGKRRFDKLTSSEHADRGRKTFGIKGSVGIS